MNDPTMNADAWYEHRAHELAKQMAQRARLKAMVEDSLPEDQKYLQASCEDDWKPHPWVIDAVIAAMKERDTENDLVQTAMVDQHESHCKHLVATTTLAVLEAAGLKKVLIDIEKQRTICDRFDIHYTQLEKEGKVVMTLVAK